VAKKPLLRSERIEVIYSDKRWALLHRLRFEAIELISILKRFNLEAITHGSIARGDVSAKSDVDVFIPTPVSSFLVETALEDANLPISRRFLVQATPFYAVKGHIEIDEHRSVSFPLTKLRPIERGFYKFGGELTLPMLELNQRVLGVDKRLMLIEPTDSGHVESTIIGREGFVANLLNISVDAVMDRVKALSRRDRIGRTGVFIKRELAPHESLESVLRELANKIPAVRKRVELE